MVVKARTWSRASVSFSANLTILNAHSRLNFVSLPDCHFKNKVLNKPICHNSEYLKYFMMYKTKDGAELK